MQWHGLRCVVEAFCTHHWFNHIPWIFAGVLSTLPNPMAIFRSNSLYVCMSNVFAPSCRFSSSRLALPHLSPFNFPRTPADLTESASLTGDTRTMAILATVVAVWFAYLLVLAVYRVFVSPLAKFPGPKLAALSKWYEFYFEVVKNGQFSFHIQDLHKRYG